MQLVNSVSGTHIMLESPFDLTNSAAYERWRDDKLARSLTRLDDFVVEIKDPRQLSASEYAELLSRCQKTNMAIYVSPIGSDPDKMIPKRLGAQFGLHQLDHNLGADEDAITSLTVRTDQAHRDYIPYSNRPIAWHTDGYYNTPERQIHGLLLHCVHAAAEGGENDLLDPELIYIQVRDHNPDYIRALMDDHCMTIPEHHADGVQRHPDRPGPVWSVHPSGHLHMRYTHRSRNIRWRDDPLTTAAVTDLKQRITTPGLGHIRARLEPGWGLISNNVLHTRSGFNDHGTPRLLYRARYYERIDNT
jgi:hypothetical protein